MFIFTAFYTVNAVPILDGFSELGGVAPPVAQKVGGLVGGLNKTIYSGATTVSQVVDKYNQLKRVNPQSPLVQTMSTIERLLRDPNEARSMVQQPYAPPQKNMYFNSPQYQGQYPSYNPQPYNPQQQPYNPRQQQPYNPQQQPYNPEPQQTSNQAHQPYNPQKQPYNPQPQQTNNQAQQPYNPQQQPYNPEQQQPYNPQQQQPFNPQQPPYNLDQQQLQSHEPYNTYKDGSYEFNQQQNHAADGSAVGEFLGRRADGMLKMIAGGAKQMVNGAGGAPSQGRPGGIITSVLSQLTGQNSNGGAPVFTTDVNGSLGMGDGLIPNRSMSAQSIEGQSVDAESVEMEAGIGTAKNLLMNGLTRAADVEANALEVNDVEEDEYEDEYGLSILTADEYDAIRARFNDLVTGGHGDEVEPLPDYLKTMENEEEIKDKERRLESIVDSNPCYLRGRLMAGTQLTNLVSKGYKHCQSICSVANDCQFFSFVSGLGLCYMFDVVTGTSANNRAVSGPRVCPEGTVDLVDPPRPGMMPKVLETLRPGSEGLGPVQRVAMNNGITQNLVTENGSLYDKVGNAFADGFEGAGYQFIEKMPRLQQMLTNPPAAEDEVDVEAVRELVSKNLSDVLRRGMGVGPISQANSTAEVSSKLVDPDEIAASIEGDNFFEEYYSKLEAAKSRELEEETDAEEPRKRVSAGHITVGATGNGGWQPQLAAQSGVTVGQLQQLNYDQQYNSYNQTGLESVNRNAQPMAPSENLAPSNGQNTRQKRQNHNRDNASGWPSYRPPNSMELSYGQPNTMPQTGQPTPSYRTNNNRPTAPRHTQGQQAAPKYSPPGAPNYTPAAPTYSVPNHQGPNPAIMPPNKYNNSTTSGYNPFVNNTGTQKQSPGVQTQNSGPIDLFDSTNSIVKAGVDIGQAFPIMDMAKAGYQLYNSGFFKRKGMYGGHGATKSASIPTPGVGKPTVECVKQGMQCCVPKKSLPRGYKRAMPVLNGQESSSCTAIEFSSDSKLCVTVDFTDPIANCGTSKIQTKDLTVYQATMVMPGKMNDAVCECIYDGKSIQSNADWKVNMAEVHDMLNKEQKSEETAEKIRQSAATAMQWTKMISDAAGQLTGQPRYGNSYGSQMPSRDMYDHVSLGDGSKFAEALRVGTALKEQIGAKFDPQIPVDELARLNSMVSSAETQVSMPSSRMEPRLPTGVPIPKSIVPTGVATSVVPTGVPVATSVPTGVPGATSVVPTGVPVATSVVPTGVPVATSVVPTGVHMPISVEKQVKALPQSTADTWEPEKTRQAYYQQYLAQYNISRN